MNNRDSKCNNLATNKKIQATHLNDYYQIDPGDQRPINSPVKYSEDNSIKTNTNKTTTNVIVFRNKTS